MSFKTLSAALSLALRNTKKSFFLDAAIDKIKEAQNKWENSVDEKEKSYNALVKELKAQGFHLPTEEELGADLSLITEYIGQLASKDTYKGILDVTVSSSKIMSDETLKIISKFFLDTKETEDLVTAFVEEQGKEVFKDIEEEIDAKLKGKEHKRKSRKVHLKSKKDIGPLVPKKVSNKAKTFKRASVVDRAKLKDQLNSILKHHVVQNMGSPALNHWDMGRGHSGTPFAQSAKVLKVSPHTISYTYNTHPYSVFDPRVSNYHNLSNAYRNPRAIISAALRDALYSLKVTQEYKYRQDHTI